MDPTSTHKYKFVEFQKYCGNCKHKDIEETKNPCNECLTSPVNEYSEKPINYVAAK